MVIAALIFSFCTLAMCLCVLTAGRAIDREAREAAERDPNTTPRDFHIGERE